MSGRAICSVALFFRCFRKHHTLLHSGCWQLASCPSALQSFLFSMACPAFLVFTLFQECLFDGWEVRLYVVRICIARLFGWPKRAYAFFPDYIQEKTNTSFLANCLIVEVLLLFLCFKASIIELLQSVSYNSDLLSNPLRWLTSIYFWTRVIIYNPAALWIAVPLSSIFQLAFWDLAAKQQDCFRPYTGSMGQAKPLVNSSSWLEISVTCACAKTRS